MLSGTCSTARGVWTLFCISLYTVDCIMGYLIQGSFFVVNMPWLKMHNQAAFTFTSQGEHYESKIIV